MLTSAEQKNDQIGFFFAFIGTALFSIKAIFIKLAFLEGVDATTVLALRMFIAFPCYLVILLYVLKKRDKTAPKLTIRSIFIILTLGFFGYYLATYLDFSGLHYISAQLERLVLFTYPIMVALLSWLFFREKITNEIWGALLLSYLGISLLYFNETSVVNENQSIGILLVAMAALSFSCYVIFSKKVISHFGSVLFTCLAMLSSTIFVVIHFFSTHQVADLNVSFKAFVLCGLIAVFSTVIPSFLISEAIHRIGPTRTGIVGSLGPVVTVVLAVMVLGETFGLSQFCGLLLVLLGVSFIHKK